MNASMVFHLHPCNGRFIEPGKRQIFDAFEHGKESAFDLGPECFLLSVLIWAVWQGVFLENAQTLEPLFGLRCDHR